MAKYKSKVTGLKQVIRELDKVGEGAVNAAKEGVQVSAQYVQKSAKRTVRKDTGAAAANIEVRYENDGLTAKVGWFDPRFYYMLWHELGTTHFKAQPGLTRAGRRGQKRFLKEVSALVEKEVE
jgi:HK97 gp10 family phage protein